jgi:hypothetical protein
MDDLQDAIQDAQYIGAMCDPVPKPEAPLALPSRSEAEVFARRIAEASPQSLTYEGVLGEPLGYYLVRVSALRCIEWQA